LTCEHIWRDMRLGFETRLSIFCERSETKYPIVDTGSVRTEPPSALIK
jgi:hypothetical protein